MDIVIIGTGNTATILGKKLREAGHNLLQVYGRNTKEASDLAYELDTESTHYWSVVNRNADIYILAVSDIAIEEVVRELNLPDRTVVHTAASVPKSVLKPFAQHYGVLYPLQSLKRDMRHDPAIPLIIDANDEQTLSHLRLLASSISGMVVQAGDEERLRLHLAAVFCNNFVNHIYVLMEDYCRAEGLDFRLLVPLIQETTLRLTEMDASHSQTGPALRQDKATLQKHRQLLEKYPALDEMYTLFTKSIQKKR